MVSSPKWNTLAASTASAPAATAGAKSATAPAPQESLLRRLRESILAAEELWNKFCAGGTGMLSPFAEQVRIALLRVPDVATGESVTLSGVNFLSIDGKVRLEARFPLTLVREVDAFVVGDRERGQNFAAVFARDTDFLQRAMLIRSEFPAVPVNVGDAFVVGIDAHPLQP